MARIRSIKPEFPQSESMGRVSRESRLCFILLWTLADDSGRLRGNSRMLASLLYPYDDDAKRLIDKWLAELAEQQCIVRYEVDGDNYIEICKWLTHQKIDHPSKSKFPEPREDSRALDKTLSGSRIKDQGLDQVPVSAEASPAQVVITLPLNDGTEHPVTESEISEWQKLYPIADVLQELRNMRGWLVANKPKRKTKTGINKFINAWLARVQDKGGPSNVNPGASNGTGKAQQRQDASIDAIRTAVTRMAGGSHGEYEGPIPEPGDYSRDGASVARGLEADGPAIRR